MSNLLIYTFLLMTWAGNLYKLSLHEGAVEFVST